MSDVFFELGRIAVGGYYDYQEIRISQRNRIRDIIRRKIEGIPLDKPEEKKEDKDFLKRYSDEKLGYYLNVLVRRGEITEYERIPTQLNKLIKRNREDRG